MSKRSISSVYSDRLLEHSGIKRNKKACTECRQQKVRCNAMVGSDDPCSRCKRMGLSCVISDPFKREHKRQRLSQLEKEANELRMRLESQQAHSQPTWNGQIPTPRMSMENTIATLSPVQKQGSVDGFPTHAQINPILSPPSEKTDFKLSPISPTSASGTLTRTIDNFTLSATAIDDCFDIYFQDFHHYLPILDTSLAPNDFYTRSPLLFWAIIGVVYRTYTNDESLLETMGEAVINLAMTSLRRPAVATIKGLLIILTWPLPKAAGSYDTTYSISGSVIHMAMQIGLHIPTSSQDFSRVRVNLTETQIVRRAELWGYCIITYQRCCSFKGHSPLALLETYQDCEQRHALFQRISPSLRFQLKLNSVVTRSCSALLQNGLRVMTREQEHALDVLIRVFEANMKDLEPEATSELDKLYFYVGRLTLQVFHFYKDQSKILPTFMATRLYTSACSVLRQIESMEQSGTMKLATVPFYFFYATSLSSFTILRLLKASTAQYMDTDAKDNLFLGVSILNKISTEANDGPARLSTVLSGLWESEKAFKDPDGTEHLTLRIRTRLAMSPVFDCIWWWREEFGGQQGAYTLSDDQPLEAQGKLDANLAQEGLAISAPNGPPAPFPDVGAANQLHDMSSFLDDHLLAEMGWNNSNSFMCPPIAGPYGTDWYSPTDVGAFAI